MAESDHSLGAFIFISYSSEELRWAKWVDWQLRELGFATVLQHYDHEQ